MRVLVTGGAGYIGSHTVLALLEAGREVGREVAHADGQKTGQTERQAAEPHEITIVDSFVNSSPAVLARLAELSGCEIKFHEFDLTDYQKTLELFQAEPFDAVIHFAGLKAVGESVEKPDLYYHNNIASALSVINAMLKTGVNKLVFSSSATVYGEHTPVPYKEDSGYHLEATNPYGQTKVIIERILNDAANANPGWKVALLRYFNPVGAHESGHIGEDPLGIPNNLMPYVAQVATGRREQLTVHGDDYDTKDGTGERDYLHVSDLAQGHVKALDHLEHQQEPARAYNLGTGQATSVLEMVEAFRRASGQAIPFTVGPRRAGDLATAYADPTRAATELGWRAEKTVDEMCADTWRWQSQNPKGYTP
ncbi:MAG: UDP-glucose 4-epimerase GalE [Cellulomonadaceae bacterium]|jgi:UDP-glucose 4-epimerase|nr:UDP-glucose 4-epimerase GalE [Cellulomonadaceae bacterium]